MNNINDDEIRPGDPPSTARPLMSPETKLEGSSLLIASSTPSTEELSDYLDRLITSLETGALKLNAISDEQRREHNKYVLHILDTYEKNLAAELRQAGSVIDEAQVVGMPTLLDELVVGEGLQQTELTMRGMLGEMTRLNSDSMRRLPAEQSASIGTEFEGLVERWMIAINSINALQCGPKVVFLHEAVSNIIGDELVSSTINYFRSLNGRITNARNEKATEHTATASINSFLVRLSTAQENSWNYWQSREEKTSPTISANWDRPSSDAWYPHYANECGQYAETVLLGEEGFEPPYPRRSIYLGALMSHKEGLGRGIYSSIGGGISVKNLRRKLQVLTLTPIKYASKAPSYKQERNAFELPFKADELDSATSLRRNSLVTIGFTAASFHYAVIRGTARESSGKARQSYVWSIRNGELKEYRHSVRRKLNLYKSSVTAILGGESTLLPVHIHSDLAVKEIVEDLKSLRLALSPSFPKLKAKSIQTLSLGNTADAWFKFEPRKKNKLEKFLSDVYTALQADIVLHASYGDIRMGSRSFITDTLRRQIDEVNETLQDNSIEEAKAYKNALKNNSGDSSRDFILSRQVEYARRRRVAVGLFYDVVQRLVEVQKGQGAGSKKHTAGELCELLFRIMDRQVGPDDIKFFSTYFPKARSETDNMELFSVIRADLNSMGLVFQGLIRFSKQRSFGNIARDFSCLKTVVMRNLERIPAWTIQTDAKRATHRDTSSDHSTQLDAMKAFQQKFGDTNNKPRYILNNNAQHDYAVVYGNHIGETDNFVFYQTEKSRVIYVVDKHWLARAKEGQGVVSIPSDQRRPTAVKRSSSLSSKM